MLLNLQDTIVKGENIMNHFVDEDMYEAMFDNYVKQYNKDYAEYGSDHPTFIKRYGAFKTNVQRIAMHNAKYEEGLESFSLGLNDLADLTDDEYRAMLGYKKNSTHAAPETFTGEGYTDLPDAWD